jgi:hypothetical protein
VQEARWAEHDRRPVIGQACFELELEFEPELGSGPGIGKVLGSPEIAPETEGM